MKWLLYLDVALLALGSTTGLTLAVVCLLFALNRQASPDITQGLPQLVNMTMDCVALGVCAAAAARGQWKHARWRWLPQALLLGGLPLFAWILYGNLGAA